MSMDTEFPKNIYTQLSDIRINKLTFWGEVYARMQLFGRGITVDIWSERVNWFM